MPNVSYTEQIFVVMNLCKSPSHHVAGTFLGAWEGKKLERGEGMRCLSSSVLGTERRLVGLVALSLSEYLRNAEIDRLCRKGRMLAVAFVAYWE